MNLILPLALLFSMNSFANNCELRYEFYTGFNFIQKEAAEAIIEKVLIEKNIKIVGSGQSEKLLYVSDYPALMGQGYQVLTDLLVAGDFANRTDSTVIIASERDIETLFERAFRKTVRFLRTCR